MAQDVIDVHVHFGAPPDPVSGCYWSEEFEDGFAYFAFRLLAGLPFGTLTTERLEKRIFKIIEGSNKVSRIVVLALDEVYDSNHQPVKDQTNLYVPNDYVAGLAAKNPRVLFGASVHPNRPFWQNDLEACVSAGAVLCKWLPSAQKIDPADPGLDPFYTELATLKLPLLCHVGPEASIPPFDDASQKLNEPWRLERALDRGVTVIAAHCALPLFSPPIGDEGTYLQLVDLMGRYPALYADISAINLGTRQDYIERIQTDIRADHLLFGSDFPIPLMDFSQKPHLSLWHWLKHFFQTLFTANPLDKNYLLIQNMEFDPIVFENAKSVLRLPHP